MLHIPTRQLRPTASPRRSSFRPILEALEDRCLPSTFTVVNTLDSGAGSLRQAIDDANATVNVDSTGDGIADPDLINFNIPGAVVHTITPVLDLPPIIFPVVIDGYTQPGASPNSNGPGQAGNAVLRIELDGSLIFNNINNNGKALFLGDAADGSTIRGLVIDNGFGAGISVNASAVHIEGCFIGVDPAGATAHGNSTGVVFELGQDTSNGVVGGTTPAARNVISGNINRGIFIRSGNHVVEGNLIGTDATGLIGIPNQIGVELESANDNLIGGSTPAARNVINGTAAGISVNSGTGNQIQGNFIQVLIDGVTPEASASNGIFLASASSSTQIGGLTSTPGTGPGNVIAGSTGIVIGSNNVIQGNLIGTDATGTKAVGIAQDGIFATGNFNTIGSDGDGVNDAEERNVISACGRSGIRLDPGSSGNPFVHDTLIQNNFIGTDITGTPNSMGNGVGIFVTIASDNDILDNVIAGNTGRGIAVSLSTTNTAILGNSIFANGALGIDLEGGTQDAFGVTENDPGDSDSGSFAPNNLQNFPVITSVNSAGGTTTITGTLNSLPSLPLLPTSFRIEFFASDAADPSGHGEGQTFLGSTDVTTDSNGDVSFTATLSATVGASQAVTATATRLDDGTPRETSEFSQVFVAAVPAVPSLSISSVSVTEGNAGTVNAVFTVTLSEASSQTVTVNFTTVDGTALTADNDYQPASGTLTFDPGQTTKTITVLVNGDTIIENDETFTVNLSNPQNATIASGAGTGAIQNDDATPPAPPPPIARAQRLTFKLVSRSAAFRNELGLFQVDSADGRIGNLRPGDPGYAAAALARRRVLFRRDDGAGTIRRITLPAGAFFGLYLVQNGSSAEVVARNHNHSSHRRPQVFFSFTAANRDRFAHLRWLSARQFAFEDLTGGGDRDFNDLVARFSVAAR